MKQISDFDKGIYRFGIISGTIILLMMMGIPVIVSLLLGYFPDFVAIIPALGMLTFILFMAFFVEMITYPPILGPGSLYMCYVTGNLVNIKLPCAIASLEASDVKTGTEEGNAVAMVAVGISSIVTMIIICIGLVFMIPLEPVLQSPSLIPVFDNVVPAMFGGLIAAKILTEAKTFFMALVLCIIGTIVLGLQQSLVMLFCMAILVFISFITYKKSIRS